jgi:hypothetical protein
MNANSNQTKSNQIKECHGALVVCVDSVEGGGPGSGSCCFRSSICTRSRLVVLGGWKVQPTGREWGRYAASGVLVG